MPRKLASRFSSALFILLLSAASSPATEPAAKKLQVFILAGQSNMVGHAHYITLPALLTAKEPGIERVRDLVIKKDSLAVGDAHAQVGARLDRGKIQTELNEKKITGEDAGTRGAAHLAGGVAAGELHALTREPVKMRALVEGRALVAEITPSEIIGEDKDDVGAALGGSLRLDQGSRQSDKQRSKEQLQLHG